jgi:hypothetical protein
MATGLEKTAVSPHTLRSVNALAPAPVNSLAQTAMNPLSRAYQAYQQYVGQPFQQAVRGGVRGYFGLPLMTDASSVGREAYRQGEALGFTPGVGVPAGAVRMAAEGMQALPSIAGDISRMIGGLPSGAAARQAEDFAAYQRSIPPSDVSPLTAFHGTPHRFAAEEGAPLGRFRSEKIGTGEGSQMYGHGLYFAENPNVAKDYKIPERRYARIQGHMSPFEERISDYIDANKTPYEMFSALTEIGYKVPKGDYETPFDNFMATYEKLKDMDSGSSVYTVDIPDAMVDKMLDWDKPLSEQPKEVQQKLQKLVDSQFGKGAWSAWSQNDPDYRDLETNLFSDKTPAEVSELLRQSGIPGIRYLDKGSRAGGEGTRNIVVFPGEEHNVKILSRD